MRLYSSIIIGILASASAVKSFSPDKSLLGGITGFLMNPKPMSDRSLLSALERSVGP